MTRVMSWWNQFWFAPGSELNFKLVRLFLFSGGAIFGIFVMDSHPPTFYETWHPISFYHLLGGPLSNNALSFLHWFWIAMALVAGFGILYPLTSLLAFLSCMVVLGHDYNFGVVYHSHHIYVMAIGILAFSELFQYIFRKNSGRAEYYRWSLQWVKCYVAYVWFLCGLEKLWAGGGLQWVFSENFYMRLWVNPYHPPLTQWILQQPLVVSQIFAGIALFAVELSAPLALWNRRTGVFYFVMWSLFHVGVTLTYGNHITFFSQIFCYSAFIDWEYYFGKKIIST